MGTKAEVRDEGGGGNAFLFGANQECGQMDSRDSRTLRLHPDLAERGGEYVGDGLQDRIPEDRNKECQVDQVNRIINLTKNKCEIDPNLYIDEYDVNASHSALIGKFSDEEMFYLESRGINKTDALKLLIKGFILSNIEIEELKNQINEKIEKYWR